MYRIIVNPIAGHGRTMQHLPLLTDLLKAHGLAYQQHVTTGIMDGYNLAREFCGAPECRGIIGIGGDGTFQEIAAGMADAHPHGQKIPVPLGIFPAGSGNDFIMTLEGGKAAALAKYKKGVALAARNFFDTIHRGRTKPIDIITANGMAFLNIGNIGLDARIVRNALSLKARYGRQAYLAAVYKSIAQHQNLPLAVEVNGDRLDKPYTLVAVCNGQYYGGGLRIAPSARLDDGKINLCLVEAMSRPKTMMLFPSLMLEKHVLLKAVRFVECEQARITLPPGQEALCLDGNLYPREGRLEFKILPRALDVFV